MAGVNPGGVYTIEPLIVNTPNKGHNRKILHLIKDVICGPFSIILVLQREDQPLYKG